MYSSQTSYISVCLLSSKCFYVYGWMDACMHVSFGSVFCKTNSDWQLDIQLDGSIEGSCLKEL